MGAALAFGILLAWLGMRPMAAAMRDPAFWMKASYTLAATLAGFWLAARLARPSGRPGPAWVVVASAVSLLAIRALWEMNQAPPEAMRPLLMGSSWNVCSGRILALALPILAVLVVALRQLGPTRLRLAGAAAGLLAGGLAGLVYGFYCQETAAAFVLLWYSLGVAAVAAIGALAGPWLLRW